MEETLYAWVNCKSGSEWFDGYTGQNIVLFDDFDSGQCSYRLLLKLLDRYPLSVQVKGGCVNWRPRIVYITSNRDPSMWYTEEPNIDALLRRIDVTISMN